MSEWLVCFYSPIAARGQGRHLSDVNDPERVKFE
jgi:hypothetical protein